MEPPRSANSCSHDGRLSEATSNPPPSFPSASLHDKIPPLKHGQIESGLEYISIHSVASRAPASSRFKALLPVHASILNLKRLVTRGRRRTWRFWVLLAFVMLLPILIVIIVPLLVVRTKANPDLIVDLGYTQYEGKSSNGINQWLGMRYAAPPTGDLRFRAPQEPLAAPRQTAHQHGALCHSTPSTSLDPRTSEDCLFLDVYAPADKSVLHPVYFFIQGGGFNSLSNANLNGSSLIEAGDHDIVVVTFNYRVGPWGFLASKEVKAGGDLNAGLLDQRKALQWVQKYIHLFGGDPKHVTIGGDSAGAASVNLHLIAYGGRDDGLFHAAIGESNSFGAQLTVEESQYQYDGLVQRTGCDKSPDTLKCLRDLDVEVIAKNNINMPTPGGVPNGLPVFMYGNVIEGPGGFCENYTYNAYGSGNFIKVPVIFGGVSNEGTIFTPPNINTLTDMNNFLKNNWVKLSTGQLDQIDKFYPQDKTRYKGKGAWWSTAATAYGEIRYNCPGIFLNDMYQNYGGGQTNWHYHWDVLTSANQASGLGVTHTEEMSSIWGSATGVEGKLIPTIQSYWTSFIRTKDPNTYKLPSAPAWAPFGPAMARLHFPNDPKNVGMEVVDPVQKDRCHYYRVISNMIGQ